MKFKFITQLFITFLITLSLISGCSSSGDNSTNDNDKSKIVKLNLAMFSPEQSMAYDKLNLKESFKNKKNIELEIEKFKDSTDFENAMKIRGAANEVPDLMGLKPYQLSTYKDILEPLDNIESAKNNIFAKDYAIDGKIYGIPECSFNEFVWYRKSIFKELNIDVPTTWDQFIEVSKKIKDDGKYIPILMGQKDDWTNYPITEFLPCLIANNGSLWNEMAMQDEPFSKESPFYKAFTNWNQLCDAEVFGKDPLGAGFDQVKVMFGSKKGAMILAGAWFIIEAKKQLNDDLSDVGTFFLPSRNSESDPFRTITMVDGFWVTPKNGKYLKESKIFIDWYMSEDWYTDYINERGLISTNINIKAEIDPVLDEAYKRIDYEPVIYDAGNSEFQKIQNATQFNYKKMGQDILSGKDLDEIMNNMNESWKKAKE